MSLVFGVHPPARCLRAPPEPPLRTWRERGSSLLGRLAALPVSAAGRRLCRPGSRAPGSQLGPRSVEVALGALGPGAQLAARLLECLRAGFHRAAQLVTLAGRVGAEPLELGGV